MAFAVDGKENLARDYIGRMTGNPLSGLCLGVVATALVQSSSGVVALTIATVAAGGMTVAQAVPLVMGANIGTGVTCVLVTLGYAVRRREFAKAVPVALLNDVVKTLSVAVFFTIEVSTHALSSLAVYASEIVSRLPVFGFVFSGFPDMLDVVIMPVLKPVGGFFGWVFPGSAYGALGLGVFSFVVLILGLELMGAAAENVLKGNASKYVHNAFRTRKRGLMLGTSFACILQSSSVATSLSIPFVVSERISLREVYPYIMGCNIGTTIDPGQIASYVKFGVVGLSVGLVHVLINVFSVVFWLGIPRVGEIPLAVAERISGVIIGSRNSVLSLIILTALMFFIFPLVVIYIT